MADPSVGRSGTSVSKVETEPLGQRGGRRWTLYDKSDDFTPRWQVGAEPTPVANEYAEWVEVMPVAEHEAIVAAAREVRAAFDAGDWPIGPSYKAVQDALRKLDSLLGSSVPPHQPGPS